MRNYENTKASGGSLDGLSSPGKGYGVGLCVALFAMTAFATLCVAFAQYKADLLGLTMRSAVSLV